jgi:hypothetical protein
MRAFLLTMALIAPVITSISIVILIFAYMAEYTYHFFKQIIQDLK